MKCKEPLGTYHWNLFTGCTKYSAGCLNCTAEAEIKKIAGQNGIPHDGPFRLTFHRKALNEPTFWRESGGSKILVIRVCSVSDFFHDEIMEKYKWIYGYVKKVVDDFPQYDFNFLTKRVENMKSVVDELWGSNIPHNAWFGASIENQKTADARVPVLLEIKTPRLFLNTQPLLGPIKLNVPPGKIDSVHCGGELGPNKRPFDPEWAKGLLQQCNVNGIFFVCRGSGYDAITCKECRPEPGHCASFVHLGHPIEIKFPDAVLDFINNWNLATN